MNVMNMPDKHELLRAILMKVNAEAEALWIEKCSEGNCEWKLLSKWLAVKWEADNTRKMFT